MADAEKVADLPVPARRHDWTTRPTRYLTASEFPDGNARTLRTCDHCGLTKVTVHFTGGGNVRREWITASGAGWIGDATPPCLP